MKANTVRAICTGALLAVLCGAPALAQNDQNNNNGTVFGQRAPDGTLYVLSPDKPNRGFYGKSTHDPVPADQEVNAAWLKFVKDAAMDGNAEVKLGHLALENASSDTVKQFAQRMIDDHSKANDELTSIARSKGVDVPSGVAAKHMAVYNRLKNLHGAAFDKAYAKVMVQDHVKAVQMFQARANSGRNADLRMWVASTTPKLREHLQMAKEMASEVGATAGR